MKEPERDGEIQRPSAGQVLEEVQVRAVRERRTMAGSEPTRFGLHARDLRMSFGAHLATPLKRLGASSPALQPVGTFV